MTIFQIGIVSWFHYTLFLYFNTKNKVRCNMNGCTLRLDDSHKLNITEQHTSKFSYNFRVVTEVESHLTYRVERQRDCNATQCKQKRTAWYLPESRMEGSKNSTGNSLQTDLRNGGSDHASCLGNRKCYSNTSPKWEACLDPKVSFPALAFCDWVT